MHVIARLNVGGTSRWIDTLVAGQREQGDEVVVLTGDVGSGEVEDPCAAELPLIRLSGWGRDISAARDARAWAELRSAIRSYRPDVVNTHTSKAGVVGRTAARSLGRTRPAVVHTFHGHLLYGYGTGWRTGAVVRAERSLTAITDGFVAVGETVRHELQDRGIGRGRPFAAIAPAAPEVVLVRRSEARARLGLSDDDVVAAWLGRFVPVKNPMRALEAARLTPDVRWVLAGEGPLLQLCRETAPSNALLPGLLPRELVLGAADLVVLTSDNEGMPYTLLEAAAAGLPVVATDVGSVSEVVAGSRPGLLVPARAETVAKAVRSLAEDVALPGLLGKTSRREGDEGASTLRFRLGHSDVYRQAMVYRQRH